MNSFWLGFVSGMATIVLIAYLIPLHIIPVQDTLVKLGHGYYDSVTKDFILKPCK